MLIESTVALVLVTMSGLVLLAAARDGLQLERAAGAQERRMEGADRLLKRLVLLPRGELERRIGTQRVDEYRVSVSRPNRTVFRIAVADTGATSELLVTLVHRAGQ